MAAIERYIQHVPKLFKPGINPIITALLTAWAQEDDTIIQQLKNTNAQLFVATAGAQYLDRLASGLGVSRDQTLQLTDPVFSQLIPNLSLKPKQVRSTIYDTLDVFWGPLFSRVNVTSQNYAPFNVTTGDTLTVTIDGGTAQSIKIRAGDVASPGAATADEVATILSRIEGATASIITETQTGHEFLNIRSNTLGLRGIVEITSGGMADAGMLNFTAKAYRITDLSQRTCIYQIKNRELIIELPALVPILRSTLKGSHHFHADSTLESPVAPENGTWQGGFLFSRSSTPYNVTSNVATLQQDVVAGQVYTQLTVDSTTGFDADGGYLVFDWGLSAQEVPVKYISIPNSQTILIDPSYQFTQTHLTGKKINFITSPLGLAVPNSDGRDLAIYMVSPSAARNAVQSLLESLVAAGVVVNFSILLPSYYENITPNPYA